MTALRIVFSCLVYLATTAWTAPEAQVAFKCTPKASFICIIPSMKFEDSSQALVLSDADKKTHLNIKAGSITALTMKHCDSLRSFEEITIGSTGLGELCVGKSFRRVSAEKNNIRLLHTNVAADNEDFRLEVLNLNDNKLSSVENMRDFVALKELNLEGNVLTKLDMSVFARMKHLEKLMLGNNRLIMITEGAVELPKLRFFGLANNALTALNVQQWNMGGLETFELASNYLTDVRGFSTLIALDKITLAANNWQCLALEEMLEALQENAVTIKDADLDCEGIRNTSICCTVYNNTSEQTLLEEMEKYAILAGRYDEATKNIENQFALYKKTFDDALENVKQSMSDKADKMSQQGVNGVPGSKQAGCKKTEDASKDTDVGDGCAAGSVKVDEKKSTDAKQLEAELCESPEIDCICPKKEADIMRSELKALLARVQECQKNATNALARQPYLQRTALLKRHEFRSAVIRGEKKLRDVRTELEMLRDYIDSKLSLLLA